MKPIHKFNNGRGATLCNKCSVIISEGLTEELFCDKCKQKQALIDMMQDDEKLGLYDETEHLLSTKANKERLLKNFAKREADLIDMMKDEIRQAFVDGAKSMQERMYSEEEVKDMMFEVFNHQRNECCVTHTKDSIVRSIIKQFKKK